MMRLLPSLVAPLGIVARTKWTDEAIRAIGEAGRRLRSPDGSKESPRGAVDSLQSHLPSPRLERRSGDVLRRSQEHARAARLRDFLFPAGRRVGNGARAHNSRAG